MITVEEARYYAWLGRSFRGVGEVVEIGSWLGRSTVCLMSGLARNPAFAGRRLHVIDDFIWRSDWMDAYVTEPPPPHGASFRPLFDRYTAAIADRLAVETRKVCDYAGNEHLPGLEWSGAAIELLVVDCGRTLAANEGWWRVLSASFLPSTTLVVMQDWQTWRETPVKPYNQTRQFTDAHAEHLRLLHELRDGGTATFLIVDQRDARSASVFTRAAQRRGRGVGRSAS